MGFLTGMLLGGLIDNATGDDTILDGALLGGFLGHMLDPGDDEEDIGFRCLECRTPLTSLTCVKCGTKHKFKS